ncbi:hypothetical protein GGR26_001283 [Lewinella marina]|uniref:DUF4340 domain-containing protein n=1 Tax=Neolewinella marina TaxID=438751 RepID=A0A2G0CFM0_9BACT|nr:hypothetical protein [Neolewinella marina]NJB85538.1 hypothetical protein [Neolewinella marina]PHK98774.1 hypothetical protein CGL56_09940 [Neolewinella marina]
MKRTLLLLGLVMVLGLLALWATRNPDGAAAQSDERSFGYPATDDIHRIFIADREGNQASLERGGPTGWRYDGYPANENAIKNLLQAVGQMAVQRLPTSKETPNLIRNLAGGGILVQLFDARGNKLRGYYIGGGTNGELGTAAIMEDSEHPYVVHLPMWSGNLRHRFNLRGDEWRSKRLYRTDPDRVEYLEIEYPRQQDKGFRLERTADGSFLLHAHANSYLPARPVPRGVAEGVLSRYEDYYISRYENADTASINRARNRLPFAIIRLKEADQPEQLVRIFPRYRWPDTPDQTLEAYTAFVNDDQDWALLAVETTQPLLIGYDSF